ncbi:MAG TPA: PPC domain-containing DNA-binding protein [Phenylobacterium sp.]|jgi:predicted DNA-binding protein with PD1-like motif|nr:PPC domain-containing DNA-binding protein [Phenylobacterium sp.]
MRTYAFRLTPGTDLRAELMRLTEQHALRAGCILSCVGSLSHARLRMPGAIGDPEVIATWAEPMEILSLTGTLCPDGLHVHISLSRRDGSCLGGHLVQGCLINTTAELVIGEAPQVEFHRPLDPATGYNELSVQPKAGGASTSSGRGP